MTRPLIRPSRPDVADPRGRGVFPALDGLRIVAVTAVIGTHCAFWTGRYARGTGRDVLAHLDVGVAIFFVISGFLISREWLTRDRATGGLPRLGAYLRRRGLRILPMYWLAVLAAFVLVPANHGFRPGDWGRHLVLFQGYGSDHLVDGLTQTWSLCVEAAFYLVLPAIAWVIVRVARTRDRVPLAAAVTAVVLALLGVAWVAFFHTMPDGRLSSAGYWLPTGLSWFMAGTWLAAVRLGAGDPTAHGHRRWQTIDRLGDSPGVCVLIALGAFGIAVTPLAGVAFDPFPGPAQAVARNVLYGVVGLALVLPAVSGRGQAYDLVLGHPVLRYLGRISYSVFLLHLMLMEGIQALLGRPRFTGDLLTLFALTWVVSIAVSALAYRFVERPAQRLRGRSRTGSVAVAATRPRPGR